MDLSAMGNIGGAVLVSGYGAMRLIKMLKGKSNNKGGNPPEPKCPEAGCQGQVEQNAHDIEEVKGDFKDFRDDIYPTINKTAEDVSFIKGWIERGKVDGK